MCSFAAIKLRKQQMGRLWGMMLIGSLLLSACGLQRQTAAALVHFTPPPLSAGFAPEPCPTAFEPDFCLPVLLTPLPIPPPPIPERQPASDSVYYNLPLPPLPRYPVAQDTQSLAAYLDFLAAFYEEQDIRYRSAPLTDCSGLMHRIFRNLQEACPSLDFPSPATARSSRALARWYYDRGQLSIIHHAADSSHLIRPGALLFFGRNGRRFRSPDIGQLCHSRGIQHIGLVVSVAYDADGTVAAYTLLHAPRPGQSISRVNRYRTNPKAPHLPAYGNWGQQWVAVAHLISEPPPDLP